MSASEAGASRAEIRPRLVAFSWTDPIAERILAEHAAIDVEVVDLMAPEEASAALGRAHGYMAITRTEAMARPEIGRRFLPDAELFARCPDLLAVCTPGAGYDVVDVGAATAAGIVVCHNPGPGAEAVAEHALGFMLALSKKIGVADKALRRDVVTDRGVFTNRQINGKTLGVVGLGHIGRRLVELCQPFGMTVLACDPYVDVDRARALGVAVVELDELLHRADFVVVTCPLTAETAGMFGAAEFARMAPEAFFISTARGEIHDEGALADALAAGRIAGAGLDVFHEEPPRPDHRLLAFDNVLATPHVAGITVEARCELAAAAAQRWTVIFDGGVPSGLVNPTVWPRYADRFEQRLGRRPSEFADARRGTR